MIDNLTVRLSISIWIYQFTRLTLREVTFLESFYLFPFRYIHAPVRLFYFTIKSKIFFNSVNCKCLKEVCFGQKESFQRVLCAPQVEVNKLVSKGKNILLTVIDVCDGKFLSTFTFPIQLEFWIYVAYQHW